MHGQQGFEFRYLVRTLLGQVSLLSWVGAEMKQKPLLRGASRLIRLVGTNQLPAFMQNRLVVTRTPEQGAVGGGAALAQYKGCQVYLRSSV